MPNPRLTFTGLHGAVTQKTKIFKIYSIKICLHNFESDLFYYFNFIINQNENMSGLGIWII
jgi:hypothetical protein